MIGKLRFVLLLVASTSCSRKPAPAPVPEPRAPSTSSPQPAPPTPAATDVLTPLAIATRLIDSVAGASELSKASIERLLGVTMTHLASALPDEEYYEAPLDGPFARVEVRVSNPKQQKFAMVMLSVRPGTQLKLDELRAAGRIRAGMPVTTNPRVPPAGTMTFVDQQPAQVLKYTFAANTQLLTGVVLERRPGG